MSLNKFYINLYTTAALVKLCYSLVFAELFNMPFYAFNTIQ